MADVKAARARQLEVEKRIEDMKKVPVSAHSQMYEQMKSALFDTQKNVEVSDKCSAKIPIGL